VRGKHDRATFPLDDLGVSLVFEHLDHKRTGASVFYWAGFYIVGAVSASVRGYPRGSSFSFLSNLNRGEGVAHRALRSGGFGTLAHYNRGEFVQPGTGFIGFAFNNGSGKQFGWARVQMGAVFADNIRTTSRCSITLMPTQVSQSKLGRRRMSRLQAWARSGCSPRVRLAFLPGARPVGKCRLKSRNKAYGCWLVAIAARTNEPRSGYFCLIPLLKLDTTKGSGLEWSDFSGRRAIMRRQKPGRRDLCSGAA
jgi:hypothetical protein